MNLYAPMGCQNHKIEGLWVPELPHFLLTTRRKSFIYIHYICGKESMPSYIKGVSYCCVTNYHKLVSLKQYPFIVLSSMGQKSRSSLAALAPPRDP
ncbi:unnamed protein product [Nyctereutes procyonoides]|uniref:(raccoon dog) hypothetical protein n=1 Tax=Nyctereutes procyonoides TaxID=34880 RepID=A0A811ZZ84_NYCPR|nr:unnamed protein product [Nyctereutes procyonoides]